MSWTRKTFAGTGMAVAALLVTALALQGQVLQEPELEWPTWEPPVQFSSSLLGMAPEAERSFPDERTVAGLWSAFIPGAGQFYKGETGKGALMLAGFVGSVIYAGVAGFGDGELCTGQGSLNCVQTSHQPNRHLAIGLGSAAGFYFWSILDAITDRGR